MTELKLNSKPETTASASRPDRRFWITGVFVGLLMVTLFLGISGGPKEKSKPLSVDPPNQNASIQEASTSNTLPAATQTVAKKKTIRKRPPTVTYADSTYGVSFRYPRKFALKAYDPAGLESADQVAMNFVEAGGVPVVSVELPESLYKGTDFVSGFFNVSVNRSLNAEQCQQFGALKQQEKADSATAEAMAPSPAENTGASVLTANFRGAEYAELETASDLSDTRYYHRFENGVCYEFALGLKTAEHESVDVGVPVDDRDVFARLEKILASVKIKSEAVPTVPALSAGAPAGSAGENTGSNQ